MKMAIIRCLAICSLIVCFTGRPVSQVKTSGDTTYITGGTYSGGENAGLMEATINGDTVTTGANTGERNDVNRVYALYEGLVYYQLAPINVNNPTGVLTIVGVPSTYGTTKPIILIKPTNGKPVVVNMLATNLVYGSLKFENVHYQAQELDGTINNELFYCGTKNQLPQSLTIDDCLFEFCNIDLFDCTNESGAIGGWPYGARFFITNSYFRNMFYAGQWWGSRVFQCKHPIDTLWIENCTITTGGLTFLQQNALTDFAYINHNTIVNNKKYWLLSPYYRMFFVTNNIFINQNWVGEDTNEVMAEDPVGRQYHTTINIDTIGATGGVVVQPKYLNADLSISSLLAPNRLQVFVSNNVNYYDPLLISGYYSTAPGTYDSTLYPLSYLGWYFPGVQKVGNIPGEWMNSRTAALFTAYAPPMGGFIEEKTTTSDPKTVTPGIADASVVVQMAKWNQYQWGDPKFPASANDILHSKYIFGDYDPTTLPGFVGGAKTDAITVNDTLNSRPGITKFTDLTENFSQTIITSTVDGFPVGSLIWDDTENAAYAAAHASEWPKVLESYLEEPGMAVKPELGVAAVFNLAQNYPNPFNPSTKIEFSLPQQSIVQLKVYNTLGQEVATLVNESLSAGVHSVNFDARDFASGLYLYRITAGNFTSVKKMMLLK